MPAAGLYVRNERRVRRGRTAFAAAPLLPAVAPRRPSRRRHAAIAGYALAALLLAADVLRHRLVLSDDALADDVMPDALVDRVLATVGGLAAVPEAA